MPDRPKDSHYNQDGSRDFDLPLSVLKSEARDSIDRLRETPRVIFGSWLVRVAIMAGLLWLANYAFGPLWWVWWALLAYAVISLVLNLVLSKMKNRQLDRIERIYDEDDARHPH